MTVASLMLFACSNDEKFPSDNGKPEDGKVIFEINAINQMDQGVGKKALYSQAATHEVEKVTIFAFVNTNSNYVYTQTFVVNGWAKGSNFMRFGVPDNQKLPSGDYKFIAVGQDASDNFTLTPLSPAPTYDNFMASITAAGQEKEIFSGVAAAIISSEGVRVNMTITRKVAGILGYFKNVPADINGTAVRYLRVTASNTDNAVDLVTGVGSMPVGTPYNIVNIDMQGQTITSEGIYAGNTIAGVTKLPNSQLGGGFLLPINSITMSVGLYDTAGIELKKWNVLDNSSTSINITANHFYSLGRKIDPATTTGNPSDPNDDDSAIDLLKDQNITVTITPQWTTVHNLVIQ